MSFVFYTNRFIPKEHDACTRGPCIFIRPECRGDIGLLEHEKVHVSQWLRTLGIHSVLYLVSRKYRLSAEVEAYRKQLVYSPGCADLFAGFVAGRYGLDVTVGQAKQLLTEAV